MTSQAPNEGASGTAPDTSSISANLERGEPGAAADGHAPHIASPPKQNQTEQSTALAALTQMIEAGIRGVGPLKGSVDLVNEYLSDERYRDDEERVDSLVRWETAKNFTTGFLTWLGGLATLPVAVPASLGSAWMIQARLVGAIATIYGHDVSEDRVRTLALMSIAGDTGKEVVKHAGIDLSGRAGKVALSKVPGRVLIDINKKLSIRLFTKAGTKGVFNLAKALPLLGGFVGGGVDAVALRIVAKAARDNFGPGPAVRAAN